MNDDPGPLGCSLLSILLLLRLCEDEEAIEQGGTDDRAEEDVTLKKSEHFNYVRIIFGKKERVWVLTDLFFTF